ncbi:MAG: cysteine synthase family protein, partial [Prevotella sp.]|nr:cysteine synthase family protein [Prevotella sp.]
MIANNITELIGNTPMVELGKISSSNGVVTPIIAKVEAFNPAGSAKDRVGKEMLEAALADGRITTESVIIEPTSGNTGIGIASFAAQKGMKVIITMPETMSVERRKLLAAYGAEIVLTPAADGMKGANEAALKLAQKYENSFIPSQFDNPANPAAHSATTGPEILVDTNGHVDVFVAGVGTGGTLSGTA